jgi:hypothetical protein
MNIAIKANRGRWTNQHAGALVPSFITSVFHVVCNGSWCTMDYWRVGSYTMQEGFQQTFCIAVVVTTATIIIIIYKQTFRVFIIKDFKNRGVD